MTEVKRKHHTHPTCWHMYRQGENARSNAGRLVNSRTSMATRTMTNRSDDDDYDDGNVEAPCPCSIRLR